MIADIRAVVWKEWRSLTHGRSRRQLLILGSFVAIWAVWLGSDWEAEGVMSFLLSLLLPALGVALTVPEAFAGERERKTLATLLASRLPDRAILYGKLIIPVLIGWLGMLLVLVLSAVVANATDPDGGIRFYSPLAIFQAVVLGFLVAVLAGALGVAISLRARSVQEAQQTLSLMMFLPAMILGFLVFVVAQLGGGIRDFAARIEGMDAGLVTLAVLAVLVLLDVLLLVLAQRRFQRGRLIATL